MKAIGSEKSTLHNHRREYRRFDCEGAITYSSFNKHDILEGKILNFSKTGMYFESDTAIKEGTPIYFRLTECRVFPYDHESCEGLRSASLAEVRWCQKVNNQSKFCIGIGVKYYNNWNFQL